MPLKSRSAASTVHRRGQPSRPRSAGSDRRRRGGRAEIVEVDPVVHHRPAVRHGARAGSGRRTRSGTPARRRSPPCSGWRPRPPAAPGRAARPVSGRWTWWNVPDAGLARPARPPAGPGSSPSPGARAPRRPAAPDEADQPGERRWGQPCAWRRGMRLQAHLLKQRGEPRNGRAAVRGGSGPRSSSPASAATRPSWAIKVSAPPRRKASTTVRTRTCFLQSPRLDNVPHRTGRRRESLSSR